MDLLSRGWGVAFPDGTLATALYSMSGVEIAREGHDFRVRIAHPKKPLEFVVPTGAIISVLGWQHWISEVQAHANAGHARS